MKKKKMQVWLLRHGMTKGNQEKRYVGKTEESILPEERKRLKEKGNDLRKLGGTLTSEEIVLYSSPLKRCKETAALFFPKWQIEVEEDFRECDFG